VVLVNHALTGNSNVAGEKGWWHPIIGEGKVIDMAFFTIIAFNIPGNGFDEDENNLIHDYKNFSAKDIANLFWEGLSVLKIKELFAVIGGSLGGGIAWEMAALKPNAIANLIPIATDWKATDWVIGNALIQDQLLNNSDDPIADARLHAMLLYRTPKSINLKFARTKLSDSSFFQVENWLLYHGMKLKKRFTLPAYKLMNHLLKTIDITKNSNDFQYEISKISANIHQIGVDSDLLFTADENKETQDKLQAIKSNIFYHEIKSIYGHDAFLIEHKQLIQILKPIFQTQKINNYVSI
jgi:homoserine O-acetyltransferase